MKWDIIYKRVGSNLYFYATVTSAEVVALSKNSNYEIIKMYEAE